MLNWYKNSITVCSLNMETIMIIPKLYAVEPVEGPTQYFPGPDLEKVGFWLKRDFSKMLKKRNLVAELSGVRLYVSGSEFVLQARMAGSNLEHHAVYGTFNKRGASDPDTTLISWLDSQEIQPFKNVSEAIAVFEKWFEHPRYAYETVTQLKEALPSKWKFFTTVKDATPIIRKWNELQEKFHSILSRGKYQFLSDEQMLALQEQVREYMNLVDESLAPLHELDAYVATKTSEKDSEFLISRYRNRHGKKMFRLNSKLLKRPSQSLVRVNFDFDYTRSEEVEGLLIDLFHSAHERQKQIKNQL